MLYGGASYGSRSYGSRIPRASIAVIPAPVGFVVMRSKQQIQPLTLDPVDRGVIPKAIIESIAVGNTKSSWSGNSTLTTWTDTFDAGIGMDRLLVVGLTTVFDSLDAVISVTYGGVAMTLAAKVQNPDGRQWSYLYYLIAPQSGINNIVTTLSPDDGVYMEMAVYNGVSQTGAIGVVTATAAVAFSPHVITTLITTLDNSWTVSTANTDGNGTGEFLSAGTGTTIRSQQFSWFALSDSNGPITPPGSTSMRMNTNAAVGRLGSIMISFGPASYLPFTPNNGLITMRSQQQMYPVPMEDASVL